jgi:hypothetical protein
MEAFHANLRSQLRSNLRGLFRHDAESFWGGHPGRDHNVADCRSLRFAPPKTFVELCTPRRKTPQEQNCEKIFAVILRDKIDCFRVDFSAMVLPTPNGSR